MSILSKKYFHDEAAAFAKLEEIIWPEGPVCPKCGNKHSEKKIYELKGVRSKPSKKNPEGIERHGLKKCGACRQQFTVRVGTVFESSHIPLHKWLQAASLLCSSKKGISSHQLHRMLEVTYKTAWFMAHRLREAMRSGDLSPMGGGGGIVEVDETFVGTTDRYRKNRAKIGVEGKRPRFWGYPHKNIVLTLINREGSARSYVVPSVKADTLMPIIRKNLADEARVITDDAGQYRNMDREYMHAYVNHSKKQWGRGEINTNTVEGYYSIFKRGMKGVYQHCSEKHLHRYMAEYDFRYSNRVKLGCGDEERTERALSGIVGKRLTYHQPSKKKAALI